jgi:hypothetical protein
MLWLCLRISLLPGSRVNLERAMLASARNSGHSVQGHVDGMGTVVKKRPDGEALWVTIGVPAELIKFIVYKGYITVDGACFVPPVHKHISLAPGSAVAHAHAFATPVSTRTRDFPCAHSPLIFFFHCMLTAQLRFIHAHSLCSLTSTHTTAPLDWHTRLTLLTRIGVHRTNTAPWDWHTRLTLLTRIGVHRTKHRTIGLAQASH